VKNLIALRANAQSAEHVTAATAIVVVAIHVNTVSHTAAAEQLLPMENS
jgi:hypothetical protein